MRFLFVDAIEQQDGPVIIGRRNFGVDEPMRSVTLSGHAVVTPSALSEAIGQLASWQCLEKNDFTARPVFLFADRIAVMTQVPVGSDVVLKAVITENDGQSFRFSGTAELNGEVVQSIDNSQCAVMPLADLEDPAVARQRFQALTSGGLKLAGAEGEPYRYDRLVDDVQILEAGRSLRAFKTFAADEPFYADHFPRFPVTPIVMLNEMIATATARCVGVEQRAALSAREITNLKIRSFVRPGEMCEVRVNIETDMPSAVRGRLIGASVEVVKGGRPILRGRYAYAVEGR
jgi:3-hydroxymyristoyl/3-hydroxydecanoyl-(acyl carrier protein) dehydratase